MYYECIKYNSYIIESFGISNICVLSFASVSYLTVRLIDCGQYLFKAKSKQ